MRKTHMIIFLAIAFYGCNKEQLSIHDKNHEVSLAISDSTIVLHHHYKCIYKTLRYGERPPYDKEKRDDFVKRNYLPKGEEIFHVKRWNFSFSDSTELIEQLSKIYTLHKELVRWGMYNNIPSPFLNIEVNPNDRMTKQLISLVNWCSTASKSITVNGVRVNSREDSYEKVTVLVNLSIKDDLLLFSTPQLNQNGLVSDSIAMDRLMNSVRENFEKHSKIHMLTPRDRRWEISQSRYIGLIPDESIYENLTIGEILALHEFFLKLKPVIIMDMKILQVNS